VIEGAVKGPGRTDVGTVSGHWSDIMEFTDKKTGKKRVIFDPSTAASAPKNVLPESEQEEYESRRSVDSIFQRCKADSQAMDEVDGCDSVNGHARRDGGEVGSRGPTTGTGEAEGGGWGGPAFALLQACGW